MAVGISALRELGLMKGKKIDLFTRPQSIILILFISIIFISATFSGFYILVQRYVSHIHLASGVELYQNTQDIDKALEKFDKAISLNPNDDFVLRTSTQALLIRLSDMINNQDLSQTEVGNIFGETLQQAIAVARHATSVNPKNMQNWVQLAGVYENIIGFASGAEVQAILAYDKAVELDPFNPSLPLAQALYITATDILQVQSAALAQSGKSDVNQEKEVLEKRTEFLNKALEKLNESIELKSNYSSARFLLAAVYQRLGELDKAIEETQNVVFLNPNDPNIAFQLGLLYWQRGNLEATRQMMDRAVSLANGTFGNARYYLGLAYEKLGDTQAAIAQFKKLQEDNPENSLVVTILDNINAGLTPLAGVGEPVPELPVFDTGGAEEPVLP